jgi:chemotaxis protein MotB
MAANGQPVIVIKKKSGHSGRHGGAWKVAYADFVTALMSLFIVLWLMSTSETVRQAVAGYFNDPKGLATLLGTTMKNTTAAVPAPMDKNKLLLKKLKERLEKEIHERKDLGKLSNQIEINITPEGLRIELLEGRKGTFYKLGSDELSENGQELLALLASELKTLPNKLLIEGHTDATPYAPSADYGNWELSADRANSARRLLQQDGVGPNQVTQVRAYADQLPLIKNNPFDARNRRITILVKNNGSRPPPTSYPGATVLGPTQNAGASGSAPKTAPHPAVKPVASAVPHPKPSPSAQSGLMGRLTRWLPGKKK